VGTKKEIYTIGHPGHSIEIFIALLSKYIINCLVDVRSHPYSKYHSQFNRKNLSASLENSKMNYTEKLTN